MRTILLIDDERPTLDMLGMFLEAYGYTVLTAETGEQGLELFEANEVDIVLTDIKMPGMDGIEVLKRIKHLNPATEVIVITGHGDMDLAIQALNLNATDFINKPVKKDALDAALKRAEERLASGRQEENEVTLQSAAGAVVMEIQGNVTSRSEPFLAEAYRKAAAQGPSNIVMRFNENTTINGAGIAVLTQLLLEGGRSGYSFAIAGLSDNFKKVFDAVGITKIASVHDTVDDAVHRLGAG
jgi:anti-anti-sigma factor